MAQFDIFENKNARTSKQFPYLLEIQSNIFSQSTRAVYIPLVKGNALRKPDKVLNGKLKINNEIYRLFPLDLASAPRSVTGKFITNVAGEGDRVIAAIDLLFARY